MKIVTGIFALTAAIVVTAGTMAVPALASGTYGAIASERGNDKIVYHAYNYSSKVAATRVALKACNSHSRGANDCVVRVWFHKKRCAAFVTTSTHTNYGFGNTRLAAVRDARRSLPGGKVVDAVCNSASGR